MIEPFIPCEKCKDSGAPPGFVYLRKSKEVLVMECSCHRDWKEKNRIRLKATEANLWTSDEILNYNPIKDYAGVESRKNISNLERFIDNFDKPEFNSASIYMWGPNGSQKTYLANWLGLEFLRRNRKVKYLLMNQLLTKLSSGFESDPEVLKFREMLMSLDLLILDESFSKDKVTLYKSGYQIPFLDSFLRERCDTNRKSILFVSNVSPVEIAENGFSPSIQDFIIRKTRPLNSIFEMRDVFMKLRTSFDVSSLFD